LPENGEIYVIGLRMGKPGDEVYLEKLLSQMQKEFEGITFATKVTGKRLVPSEIIVDLTIKLTTGIAIAVFIKFLERLWGELGRQELTPHTFGPDDIQARAERYLLSIGISDFGVIRRIDKGPYVEFVFKDGKGHEHKVVITSFDLRILSYEKKGRK